MASSKDQAAKRDVTNEVVNTLIAFAIGYGVAEAFGHITGRNTPSWLSVACGTAVVASIHWHKEHDY